MKTLVSLSAIIMASTALSSAAVVIWSTPQTIAGSDDVNLTGTTVFARNIGTGFGDPTSIVNGVDFGFNNPNWSVTYAESFPNMSFSAGTVTGPGGAALTGGDAADYGNILSFGRNSGASASITLGNLTVGQQYLVQFWAGDYRAFPNNRAETITVDASTSAPVLFLDSDGPIHGQFVTGTFTATNTSTVFNFNSVPGFDAETQYNALQLRAIPEPTSAALLALGGLAVILRRRK